MNNLPKDLRFLLVEAIKPYSAEDLELPNHSYCGQEARKLASKVIADAFNLCSRITHRDKTSYVHSVTIKPSPIPQQEKSILRDAVMEAADKFYILSSYIQDETAKECAQATCNKMLVALGRAPWDFGK